MTSNVADEIIVAAPGVAPTSELTPSTSAAVYIEPAPIPAPDTLGNQISIDVPQSTVAAAPERPFRIPKRKRALSVGSMIELLDETKRLHRKRKQTTSYQGPLLFAPSWVAVPEPPPLPRHRDVKSQTYFPEIPRRDVPRLTSTGPNNSYLLQISEIANENELIHQLYKRIAVSKILYGRGVMEDGEELRSEWARIQRAITGVDHTGIDIRSEISRFLQDLETQQRNVEQQAQEAAAFSHYVRAVLEARWEQMNIAAGARILARQQEANERRTAMAQQAVAAFFDFANRERSHRQRQTQNPPIPAKKHTPAMTRRPLPGSSTEQREIVMLDEQEQQSSSKRPPLPLQRKRVLPPLPSKQNRKQNTKTTKL